MNSKTRNRALIAIGLIIVGCFIGIFVHKMLPVRVPANFKDTALTAKIYPDYNGVTIPPNIAPLHFEIQQSADAYVTRMRTQHEEWVGEGQKALTPIKTWRKLTNDAKGGKIDVEVFVKKDGQWLRCKPFCLYVAPEEIDPYISYRLIAPSYVTYEELTINQRNITNYNEKIVYDNMLNATEDKGQCINCHSYQMYNPARMQFHARQNLGGTIICYDGKITKVNMKNDSTLSAGVYPAWHPFLKLIAYSTNKTGQSFHTRHPNKIEVEDLQSDLILYDVDKNEVTNVENDSTEFEVFPWWSPDGKYLYYCSAHFLFHTANHDFEAIQRYQEIKYSIYRRSFDLKTHAFGPKEMVYNAAALGKSATLPRISPDGRYLLFARGSYGCFHIWHKDADLFMMDLRTMKVRPLTELNSPDVESYHSWSSNSRWILFSSRRYDGGFTRLYIGYMDKTGRGRKPFVVPQDDPDFYLQFYKSYNVPEFMKGPITITPQQFASAIKRKAEPAKFVSQFKK
jgi:hypothetical protein